MSHDFKWHKKAGALMPRFVYALCGNRKASPRYMTDENEKVTCERCKWLIKKQLN